MGCVVRKHEVVHQILTKANGSSAREKGLAYAPTNIALCKYWGKRNNELNLPMNSSLSIALPDKGAMTTLHFIEDSSDNIVLNGSLLPADTNFVRRIVQFLDLFRKDKNWRLHVDINMNIPVAAGLASSACGFASLTLALNDLFNWQLSLNYLSILARLGSGSASRSLWAGFVEWQAGVQSDGMDSFSQPYMITWPELRVGILPISFAEKLYSSRDAMQRTVATSVLYENWTKKVVQDMALLKQAIELKNFSLLGGTAESNALNMHATMLSSWPPICYALPETIDAMHQIWKLRQEGLSLYFTQDAGPNLKLLFEDKDEATIKKHFPLADIINPFAV